jgi:hypothetical protein
MEDQLEKKSSVIEDPNEEATQISEKNLIDEQQENLEQPWSNDVDTENDDVETKVATTDTTLSHSMSNDFTYTTFGKPLDSDENQNDDTSLASPSALQFDKLIVSEINDDASKLKNETLDLHSVDIVEAKNEASSNDFKSESEDSIKKMSFDSIIENVKLNKIANKEVCDYILNLLVNGEFDLEKKFVIQNIKSIMHMIQVIKCARPSLKVNKILVVKI